MIHKYIQCTVYCIPCIYISKIINNTSSAARENLPAGGGDVCLSGCEWVWIRKRIRDRVGWVQHDTIRHDAILYDIVLDIVLDIVHGVRGRCQKK